MPVSPFRVQQTMLSVSRVMSGRATLATFTEGAGAPVIFLHANVCDSRMWASQMSEISTRYKTIAYDRRGFGETRTGTEDFSPVADLKTVIDATTDGEQPILVGCSQGGKIAIDAALQYPSLIRALVLIAPSVGGAPEAVYSSETQALLAQQKDAEEAGALDRLNAIKARLWLDGPLAPEGRVKGPARQLFLDMNAIALRSPPSGASLDVAPAFPRLGDIQMPSFVIWGDLDFPHIQERCRHLASAIPNGSGHELAGAAHLPSLEQPAEVTRLLTEFLDRCPDRR